MSRIDVVAAMQCLAGEPGPFPFVTRVIDLPPLVAQAAFDAVRQNRLQAGQSEHWVIHTVPGRLEMTGPARPNPPPRNCYWSHREVRGTIRPYSWPTSGPIAVRLELLPWSATCSALGVSVRRLPYLASQSLYLDVGTAALKVVAKEMDRWALQELHEVERALRAAS